MLIALYPTYSSTKNFLKAEELTFKKYASFEAFNFQLHQEFF